MQTAIPRPLTVLLCAFGLACFAPVAALADITFVTGVTNFGAAANNYNGGVGLKFGNGTGTSVTITQLGRWVLSGNSRTHVLSIYVPPSLTPVATVTVNCSGAPPGQFLYGTLGTPYILAPGASCYIMSAETNGGDYWYNNNNTVITIGDIGGIQSAYNTGSFFDSGNNGGAYTSAGSVAFKYSTPLQNWTKNGTIYSTDGSLYSVNSALNDSAAGDTINVPAGTFTWGTFGTSIFVNKAVTLAGAGPALTTITIGADAPKYGNGTISVSAAAVITGFTFNQQGASSTSVFSCSTTNGWRITNCTYNDGWTSGSWNVGYFVYASNYGLIDSCTINVPLGNDEYLFTRGPTDSWQTPSSMGTANAVYMEDCTINGTGYNDFNSNARGVIRYCTYTGSSKVDSHGYSTNSPPRGVRQTEIYGNHWTGTSGFFTSIEIRGGTGMVFDNTSANTLSGNFGLVDYGYQTNLTNWTVYQTPANYPLIDQIGVGADPKVGGSEPVYVVNNTKNGSPWVRVHAAVAAGASALYGSTFVEENIIQANRDFFADAGYDSLATGVSRGTTAQMNALTPSVVGYGFWVTDQGSWNTTLPANTSGQLYVWNGSSWVLKYTPYTYPHPLRSGSPPTGAPHNARVSITVH